MIYNDRFVWLHFPKCAGSKIEQIFSTYFSDEKSIIQDLIDVDNDPAISWHDSIHDREKRNPEFKLNGRTVVCSIRKLPSWLESRYNFEYQRSPNLNHAPELLMKGKFLESNGFQNHADYYVEKYLPKSILESVNVKFIRTEFFRADFLSVFGEFTDVSRIPDFEFEKRLNKSKKYIPDTIRSQLYGNQVQLYKNCPYWKLVEKYSYK